MLFIASSSVTCGSIISTEWLNGITGSVSVCVVGGGAPIYQQEEVTGPFIELTTIPLCSSHINTLPKAAGVHGCVIQ